MLSTLRTVSRAAHLALTFLTTLPLPHVGEVRDGEFARASGFYPLAGYVVGGGVALALLVTSTLPSGVGAALALIAWLTVTGMLHFDGLVDASDAVFAMKTPRRRVEILSDVHVGAFGLAAGVTSLLMKWSLLGASPHPGWIVVAAVFARAALLAPMNFFPAARAESLGARSREGWWPVAVIVAAPAALLAGGWWQAITAASVALGAALVVARFCAGRLGGGIGGDVYGAIVEVTEISVLLALVAAS
ncbi:cobalamin-5'-phosphate synthase [Deinococcus yavapaiensis KR-236]|uniref:Adenosylcobinamide-GDP ribazoletransferase n=1 Tax=Deinococcus yavapaiensis KR-236 TaxID=694435 RepID=A0A318SAY7_9DEIO|nr:adenosylcobinamide-GDP ribazoletransferase [Deinococcus yavapaiensis]PYE53401.1 cobalamin-5'-phosphate synthase [Deinococcus yavapaiensis KR-236]